jgi:small-conductance mechanosensitive channel/CRP-like cAMP-binding protein
MFEILFSQIPDLAIATTNDRAFLGVFGIIIFLVVIVALTRISTKIRDSGVFWCVEALVAPLAAYVIAALCETAIEALGTADQLVTGGSPMFSVPLILLTAYLFNRATRLFVWQGILARQALAVPKIVWNVLNMLAYVAAIYAILAFVYDQPMTGFVISSGVIIGTLGFAFQPILIDVLAGISLSIERPFSTGDWIELGDGSMGEVINIDWRATEIRTWNNTVQVVPNGKLSNASIQNYDRPDSTYRFWFNVTVARTISPVLVRRLLLEAALRSKLVLAEPLPLITIHDVQDRPIQYMIIVSCQNYRDSFATKTAVLQNIWFLFTKSGFNFSASPQDIALHRGEPHEAIEQDASMLLKEVSLLQPLSDAERAKLAQDGIHHWFSPGDKIITEDEPGESMFIILAGMVLVQRTLTNGQVLDLARLGTYDYFGEMSLLTGEARSASVVAYTECNVLEVPKHSLEPMFAQRSELAVEIATLMAERKLKSELMTAETHNISVSDRLRVYSEEFAKSILSFFSK